MPSDMRLQCPSEDTPPSTRPPSVASSAPSTSGTPRRSASMDSLQTNLSMDKPVGEEYIPTRMIRASPKANANALQFIKTGPALLHKSAKEQMKKAEVVKSLRKTSLQEEEEWQSTQSSPVSSNVVDEASDWQTNLDKWKSGRRKRNEDVLERVIEVKKFEQQDELEGFRGRRKSKTFNEMREEKNRRGRRYNLVVHDDDNNDLSDLGLNVTKNGSLSEPTDEPESTRNADTKSDAGFCTGSDTGSDGVFAEDSISDTSSALGDKREIHDSLESGVSSVLKENEVITNGHHVAVPMTITKKGVGSNLEEYTYAKAIEDYKQFAENSVKKRTSSASSTASGGLKDDERASVASKKIEDRLSFFDSLEKTPAPLKDPRLLRRDRAQTKVDLDKRRSMFELRDLDQSSQRGENKRRSTANLSSSSLRHKVASFENVNDAPSLARGPTKAPPRDMKFKEKLASFSLKEKGLGVPAPPKKSLARDQNFYEKLQNFSRMESREATSPTDWKGPSRMQTTKAGSSWRSTPPAPLKDRIASFENLSPTGETSPARREFSASMENLYCQRSSSLREGVRPLNASQSVSNLYPFRRVPPTPFMVVELEEEEDRREEQPCVRVDVLASSTPPTGASTPTDYEVKSTKENGERNEPKPIATSSPSACMMPQPVSPTRSTPLQHSGPDHPPPTQSEVPLTSISSLSHPEEVDSSIPSEIPLGRIPRKLPELPTSTQMPDDNLPSVLPLLPTPNNPTDTWVDNSSMGSPFPEAGLVETKRTSGMALNSGECQYGDRDIDEVINTYEPSSKHVPTGDEICYQEPFLPQLPTDPNPQKNVYEKIGEDEILYENIYEKVPDNLETRDGLDHQYQTLEEVNTQKADISEPLPESHPLPPRNQSSPVIEVLDVTWTEDGCSVPAAPPSHPPPPPPPEEDLGEEEELEDLASSGGSRPASTTLPSAYAENEARMSERAATSSSPPLVKSSLRKQMSDFLGTKPYVAEELTLQPPPDVNELLRKEREAERLIVQRQASLSRTTTLPDSDFSASISSLGRQKYTWEDRMKADGPKSKVDLDESSDHLEFQAKLAELEQEMEKHDRHMLQKIKGPHVPSLDLTPDRLPVDESRYATDLPKTSSVPQHTIDFPKTSSLPHYSSDFPKTPENLNPPLFATNLASSAAPATHLPIQEFYTAPSFTQYELDHASANDCVSASGGFVSCNTDVQSIYTESSLDRASEAKKVEKVDGVSKGAQQAPPPLPRKSILALSAIPKPRLTDNDSWIMKRKNEPAKRDYSKHWLIQEAEQRRLEQQDRISRPSQLPLNKPTPTSLQSTTGYQNNFQNVKSSFHNISPTSYNSPSFSSNGSTVSSNGSSISNSRPTAGYENGHISSLHPPLDTQHKPASNNFSSTIPTNIVGSNGTSTVPTPSNLKKQTKTYQPPQPSPTGISKPLPDAIINTITQRVNNKNKMNGSTRPTVYNSTSSSCSYRADDNYHDYMNTDSFSSSHANDIPLGASPMVPPSPPQGSGHYLPGGNPSPAHASEDQRLLSVSGKKKCSHCGEELGRGAAMIIESLRLFYHIPCFKCCVCGTQLGNGTSGADVRVRNHKLHCHNCYSNDEGMKFSKV